MTAEIQTPRLVMRQPDASDAEALWSITRDPALTQYLAWAPHTDPAQTASVIEALRAGQALGSACHWLVLQEARIVGLVSLIDIKHEHLSWTLKRAELAFWTAPDAQGRGFATEASRAALSYGFTSLALEKIRVAHARENHASERVCRRLGFTEYATERRAFCKAGVWHDLVWYDMLPSELDLTAP